MLGEVIERLYASFSRYPVDPAMSGCDHCVDASEAAALANVPLRSLTGERLGRYAAKGRLQVKADWRSTSCVGGPEGSSRP